MSPWNDLVFITGATGFIGTHTLCALLRDGYRVRAAVRSKARGEALLGHPEVQALNPGAQLTFAIVPDIAAPGAYGSALDDVTHVIHHASPLASGADTIPPDQHEGHFVTPAVRGTLNLLEAAASAGSVRRVVITSSFIALVSMAELEGTCRRNPQRPVTADDRVPFAPGPYKSNFAAYQASKVAALLEADAWVARERPGFEVVHLHPGFVLGPHLGATTPQELMRSTNSSVLALLLGQRGLSFPGAVVHVEDVARAHVAALSPRVVVYGGGGFILSQPARWNDAIGVAKRAFPKGFESRTLVERGDLGTIDLPMDTATAERALRFEFRGFEEQVRSVVGQYLELRRAKSGINGSRAGRGAAKHQASSQSSRAKA